MVAALGNENPCFRQNHVGNAAGFVFRSSANGKSSAEVLCELPKIRSVEVVRI